MGALLASSTSLSLRDVIAGIVLFLVTRLFLSYLLRAVSGRRPLPPGPKGWPFIGCLPLLGRMPHVSLFELAKVYGPVMYLKLGTSAMVVASSPAAAKAFLKTLDTTFTNRPPNAGATHMAYNAEDLVFADYGPRWKLLRKLSNLHMLGGKALDDWAAVRRAEMVHMFRTVQDHARRGEAVDVPELLSYGIANMMGMVMLSKRVFESGGSESSEFKVMVVELMTLAGLFNVGDFIPSIAWMDLQGIEGAMKRVHLKWDALIRRMIEEHEATREERKGKPDMLDAVMQYRTDNEVKGGGDGEKLTMTNIKALLLNLFAAGTDTSSSIIEWAMAELLYSPAILRRAQAEMDSVIGRERRLEESDIRRLPYFQAICKETFRKHPSTPLNLPRVATQPCEVNGFYIPKNTRLMVNIWGMGRDPNVWDKPLEFNPDRFLTPELSKIEPRGNDFELIPFGAGRRICAGTRMGIVMVEYILGSLVHAFDWKMPDGGKVDMAETFGIALQKAVPVKAMATPRLAPHVYA
ncbi:flavonoid 3',5'-hydroxylase 1-like [Nymphaea colorata]|nr:flavonoid 3',5'-hydroxylase 1-like [Nymphaea colorata]